MELGQGLFQFVYQSLGQGVAFLRPVQLYKCYSRIPYGNNERRGIGSLHVLGRGVEFSGGRKWRW